MFWKPAPFSFAGKEAPNLVDPSVRAVLSHWTSQKQFVIKMAEALA